MSTISLCLIVKNEEKILEQALDSIYKIADEIIIVDTGSTDKTIDIAKKYTNKVYHFKWIDDFSAARNYAQSFATKEYILRWDADWILRDAPKAMIKMQKLKQEGFEGADIVNFTWNLEFGDGGRATLSQAYSFIYKNKMFEWKFPIHEILSPIGSLKNSFEIKNLDSLDIQIDNSKDPSEKAWRYDQTKDILKNLIKKDSKNWYFLKMYADALLFDKKFQQAFDNYQKCIRLVNLNDQDTKAYVLEKAILCLMNLGELDKALELYNQHAEVVKNKKSVELIYADLKSLKNSKEAIDLYLKFLSKPLSSEDKKLDYSPDRFLIHPHRMLFKLYLKEGDFLKSLSHCFSVILKSSSIQEKLKFVILGFLSPLSLKK